MIDTGSSSMQRIGDFADKSLAGTGTESLVSYVLRGEGDQTDEKTSASQIDSSVKQPLLRHAATPVGGASAQGNEPRSKTPPSSILPDEVAGEAKEAGRIRDSHPGSTNANDCPGTPPSTSGSMSPLIPSSHRPGANEAYCLLSAKELPEWFEPYGFAFEGYRVGLTTPQTWHSVFRCHNETQNIWTEFGPLFAFCVLQLGAFCHCVSCAFRALRFETRPGQFFCGGPQPVCVCILEACVCVSVSAS